RLGTFSKGMRQRIAIGQALMNGPSVIILDEPTSGLDPRGQAEMREILKNLRNDSNDLTVIMSSHVLHEVSDLCDRIALINHGKMILQDDMSIIGKADGRRRMTVKVDSVPNKEMTSKIEGLENVVSAERYGNEIEVTINGGIDVCVRFFNDIGTLNIGAYALSEEDALESTYLNLIKESR
ncbi:MAG: ATP-binding cassette domain-containing protein, partial [Methanomassiliicoccaceae archaeon]|nr:ATP-binding cassette domain-containing protein [Methanomassiliicoccaceae archaeon]